MMMMIEFYGRILILILMIFKGYAKYELPPNTPIQVGIGIDITDIPKVRLNIATKL